MNDKPRRGAPANAFKDYPGLNEAYLIARDNVNLIIGGWNRKNPGNEVVQIDVPLMLFIHSCIPAALNPEPFENHSKSVRPRMQRIVYPLISSKSLDLDEFADKIMDSRAAEAFLKTWLSNKAPRRATPAKQPRPAIKDYLRDGFVAPNSKIILRYLGRSYQGHITPTGQVEMDLGRGLQTFKSPNAVLDKGLNATGVTASDRMYIIEDSGQELCLQDIRLKYIEWKGL